MAVRTLAELRQIRAASPSRSLFRSPRVRPHATLAPVQEVELGIRAPSPPGALPGGSDRVRPGVTSGVPSARQDKPEESDRTLVWAGMPDSRAAWPMRADVQPQALTPLAALGLRVALSALRLSRRRERHCTSGATRAEALCVPVAPRERSVGRASASANSRPASIGGIALVGQSLELGQHHLGQAQRDRLQRGLEARSASSSRCFGILFLAVMSTVTGGDHADRLQSEHDCNRAPPFRGPRDMLRGPNFDARHDALSFQRAQFAVNAAIGPRRPLMCGCVRRSRGGDRRPWPRCGRCRRRRGPRLRSP